MVGHQAVADQSGVMFLYVFPQQAQIRIPVRVAAQDKLSRIAALRYMMCNFYGNHPGESCHAYLPAG
jgi:hypothetical protein